MRSKEECLLDEAFKDLKIAEDWQASLLAFLAPLKEKGEVGQYHYLHSIRVALTAKAIGEFMGVDSKALFYAGLLHDVGKALTNPKTLGQTSCWTAEDAKEIQGHVIDGFRLLRGRFDFSASILLWHHEFQRNAYPLELPKPLHPFSKGTEVTIAIYGRLLAIADTYDAMHRVNSETGGMRLTDPEIKVNMLKSHPDQKVLIENLYKAGVLT